MIYDGTLLSLFASQPGILWLAYMLIVQISLILTCTKKEKAKTPVKVSKPRYESRVAFNDRNVKLEVDDSFLTSGHASRNLQSLPSTGVRSSLPKDKPPNKGTKLKQPT
ncbi:hypothetical protein Ddc_02934 [Ditylenchus destructor]|nr:hypothetical protein Ddc_02934 [Ditylenchus destructor]